MTAIPQLDTNAIAVLASIAGGIVVKLIEKWAVNRNNSFSEGEKIRNELRLEVDKLRKDIETSHTAVDIWRGKYWDSVERETTDEHKIEELSVEVSDLHAENKLLRDFIKNNNLSNPSI
jgi:hypothetical protein